MKEREKTQQLLALELHKSYESTAMEKITANAMQDQVQGRSRSELGETRRMLKEQEKRKFEQRQEQLRRQQQ